MVEVYFILMIIAIRVILDGLMLASAVGNRILKEEKSKRKLVYWMFIYMTDLLLMAVGIACLILLF